MAAAVTPIALRFAYDGTRFPSYARDPGQAGSVEEYIEQILGLEGLVAGSWRTGSRTDAGVSAIANVIRVDLSRPTLNGLLPALQSRAPPGLWFTAYAIVDAGWNPRHAAWREYQYFASGPAATGTGARKALLRAQKAADIFVGVHNMSAFARVEEGRNPTRKVFSFAVTAAGDEWCYTIRGQSFLWHQVRRMVGAIQALCDGTITAEEITTALATGTHNPRFRLAPAGGLLLADVHYEGLEWITDAATVNRRLLAAHQEARLRIALTGTLMDRRAKAS